MRPTALGMLASAVQSTGVAGCTGWGGVPDGRRSASPSSVVPQGPGRCGGRLPCHADRPPPHAGRLTRTPRGRQLLLAPPQALHHAAAAPSSRAGAWWTTRSGSCWWATCSRRLRARSRRRPATRTAAGTWTRCWPSRAPSSSWASWPPSWRRGGSATSPPGAGSAPGWSASLYVCGGGRWRLGCDGDSAQGPGAHAWDGCERREGGTHGLGRAAEVLMLCTCLRPPMSCVRVCAAARLARTWRKRCSSGWATRMTRCPRTSTSSSPRCALQTAAWERATGARERVQLSQSSLVWPKTARAAGLSWRLRMSCVHASVPRLHFFTPRLASCRSPCTPHPAWLQALQTLKPSRRPPCMRAPRAAAQVHHAGAGRVAVELCDGQVRHARRPPRAVRAVRRRHPARRRPRPLGPLGILRLRAPGWRRRGGGGAAARRRAAEP